VTRDLQDDRPRTTDATITVSALIRQGEGILLVYQQRKEDPYPTWALPGGRLEDGESLAHGLVREVREETGLIIDRVGKLVSVAHQLDKRTASQAVSFVFETGEWAGIVAPADPEGVVRAAQFFPTAEAIVRMGRNSRRAMFEPVVSYLSGSHPAGTVWLYSEHDDGQKLLATLPEQPEGSFRQ
jgi:ADP-ribose pyrophosphatase YjhB (NUDIX family)